MRKHLYESKRSKKDGSLWLSLLMFALMIAFFLFAVMFIDQRQRENETEELSEAIRHALVTCYAVEGRYPRNLSYLTENYGVMIDHKRYLVRYDAFAENLMPDVGVSVRKGAG